ncbi:hypothetical protein RQP46_007145 [Phenoliferia psychrophenolica]
MARTRRASKLATPALPLEIIADIIDFTISLLIDEELDLDLESYAPLANRFLLSAALVNRAWHPLATKALLRCGLVASESVPGFLSQVATLGMDETLDRVRFGERANAGDGGDDDAMLDLLLVSLPGITSIELVESKSIFQTRIPALHSIKRLSLLTSTPLPLHCNYLRKFLYCLPEHLFITESPRRRPTQEAPVSLDDLNAMDHFLAYLLPILRLTLKISTPLDATLFFSVLVKLGQDGAGIMPSPLLGSCHFECTSFAGFDRLAGFIEDFIDSSGRPASEFPELKHLATHLLVAYHLVLPGTQDALASLEILPDPPGEPDLGNMILEPAEPKILELIEDLPVLAKLKLPACWASDAVRARCEAKGVELCTE